MKKTILLVAMALGFSSSYAQLTTRENDNSVEKLGARPVAGDMGFTFGIDLSAKDSGLFSGNLLQLGNVLTYKYYLADDMVIRAGLRINQSSNSAKGAEADSSTNYSSPTTGGNFGTNQITEVKYKSVDRMVELVPGVEKHFSASNFFDAYMGADLYLGLGKERTVNNIEYKNGDFSNTDARTPNRMVGLGFITGMNIFVAHLPISIGLEYGWTAKWTFAGKTKHMDDGQSGSGSSTVTTWDEEYFTNDGGAIGTGNSTSNTTRYSKLKTRSFLAETNQDVRIVLNVYFGK